ncbi:MAG: glycosyltransferase family 39 protein [Vicinamibacterales bacterium]
MTRREIGRLAAILAGVFLTRIGLAAIVVLVRHDISAFHVPDSGRYLTLGAEMVFHHRYAFEGRPELFRPPGYPLLLAMGQWIGHATALAVVVQALLGVATTGLCFVAGRMAGGARVGLAAALLYACEPGQIAWSTIVMSETLFTALLAGSLAALYGWLRSGRRWAVVVAAALLALAAYVRVVGYWLPFVLVLVLAATWRSMAAEARRARDGATPPRPTSRARALASGVARQRLPRPLRDVTLAAVVAASILAGWHVRNGVVTGYWGFSSQFSRALFFMGGGPVEARERDTTYFAAHDRLSDELNQRLSDQTPGGVAAGMRRRGLQLMLAHPVPFLSTYAAGIASALVHPGTGVFVRLFTPNLQDREASATQMLILRRWTDSRDRLAQKSLGFLLLSAILFAVNIVYWSLGAVGAWQGRRSPYVWIAGVFVAYFVLPAGGPDADSRRRAPLVPAMCVIAAHAQLRSRLLGRRADGPVAAGGRFLAVGSEISASAT